MAKYIQRQSLYGHYVHTLEAQAVNGRRKPQARFMSLDKLRYAGLYLVLAHNGVGSTSGGTGWLVTHFFSLPRYLNPSCNRRIVLVNWPTRVHSRP